MDRILEKENIILSFNKITNKLLSIFFFLANFSLLNSTSVNFSMEFFSYLILGELEEEMTR